MMLSTAVATSLVQRTTSSSFSNLAQRSIFVQVLTSMNFTNLKPVFIFALFFFILHYLTHLVSPYLVPKVLVLRAAKPLIKPGILADLRGLRLMIFEKARWISNKLDFSSFDWDWDQRIPAMVHAIVVSFLGLRYFKLTKYSGIKNLITGRRPHVDLLFAFSLGYFLYDCICATFLIDIQKGGLTFLIHGYVSFISFALFYFVSLLPFLVN